MLKKAISIMMSNLCKGRMQFWAPGAEQHLRYISTGECSALPLVTTTSKTIPLKDHYPSSSHNYPEFVQLIEGSANLNLADQSLLLDDQFGHLILPKTIHNESSISEHRPYKLLWTVFTPSGINLFISVYSPEHEFQIHAERLLGYGPKEIIESLWPIVRQLSLPEDKLGQAKFQALMIQLCLSALAYLEEPATNRPNYHLTLGNQIQSYINEHFHEEITINELSQMARCTPNYLNGLFRKHTGQPIHQFILQKRLLRAKDLLREDNASVKEVAYKLGFTDPLYFSRLFRKKFGFPPSKLNESKPAKS
jgi:AraC-like DNA-binding protein